MARQTKQEEAVLAAADAVGGLMEFWGFKRNMGRMWTVLYLAREPLPSAELARRLSLSAGAVSMTASALSRWGVIRKVSKPGDRRDFYEPETDIWKMVSRVFQDRELRQIDVAIDSFAATATALREGIAGVESGEAAADLRFALERVEGLQELARVGKQILSGLLAGQAIDNPLKKDDSPSK